MRRAWARFAAGVIAIFVVSTRARAQQTVAAQPSAERGGSVESERLLNRLISVELERVSLKQAIDSIAMLGKIEVQYRLTTVSAHRSPVSVRAVQVPLGAVLDRILQGTGLQVVPLKGVRFSLEPGGDGAMAVGAVMGTVADAKSRKPLRGVSVTIDDTIGSVKTGESGEFRFVKVAAGQHRLAVRTIGYARQTKVISVMNGQSVHVDFWLEGSTNQLDQVVVTGTVTPTSLKAVPNAITVITAVDIERRGITRIDQLFHGDIPGLYAVNDGESDENSPGRVLMSSRGSTDLGYSLSKPIKVYVDGVELAESSLLGLIDPKSIDRIEVLNGPQASTIYGSGAINGVMQVFTKRGATPRPQLVATIQGGFLQNNFTSSLAPQHDDMVQVSGISGPVSYNVGGSWTYIGPWSPSIHLSTMSGFGGIRLQQGPVTADLSLRHTQSANRMQSFTQAYLVGIANGTYPLVAASIGAATPDQTVTNTGETIGLTVTYLPVAWWSHTLTMGKDAFIQDVITGRPRYTGPSDTLMAWGMSLTNRLTMSYVSTIQVPIRDVAHVSVTGGIDGWNYSSATGSLRAVSVTDATLPAASTNATYTIGHNRGAFVQGMLGFWDALFFTYGLRAEWNPNFGQDIRPNYAPRYGVAYTRDFGILTAKLRAGYGRATEPPDPGLTKEITLAQGNPGIIPLYGNGVQQVGNRHLLPARQQGGEGGLDVYIGNRFALSVTRYNQVVSNLIAEGIVDSLDMLPDQLDQAGCAPWQCPFYVTEFLNVGSVRNQGWETQGSVTTGLLTTTGTYSWSKSRLIGITPEWQTAIARFNTYKPGASFSAFPEHTWALGTTYARSGTSISLNLHGQGFLYGFSTNATSLGVLINRARLLADKPRVSVPDGFLYQVPGYVTGDLNVSRRITAQIDGLLQVQNVSNAYRNDNTVLNASLGRQTKFGMRIRL